jgi:hypothetical protein
LLHLDLGPRESSDAWLSFLQDLTARGLKDPLLVVMDGAPGLVKAIKRVWPHAYRQRCQVHKMRNILSKLPRMMQAKMKALVHQVFRARSSSCSSSGRPTSIGTMAYRQNLRPVCLRCPLDATRCGRGERGPPGGVTSMLRDYALYAALVFAVSSVPNHSTTLPFLNVKRWTPLSCVIFLPFFLNVTSKLSVQ